MSPKKRLLFISNLFPDVREPYRGLDNATILQCLSAEYEIRVVALRPKLPLGPKTKYEARPEDAIFSPKYLEVPYVPKVGSRWNHRLMARALRDEIGEAPLVLSSWIYPDSCAVARLSAELGFRFVCIAQGSDVHQYLKMPARRRIIVESLAKASAVITRSGELARLLKEAGVAGEKLHPVYNGIDFEVFRPGDQRQARQELGLPTEGKLALFVGNFYAIKNPLLLIEAFVKLRGTGELPRLVMIGAGHLEARARALALELGVPVIFAGRKSAGEVAQYMRAADLLCLPSQNEGVPNVILEAFASGLPVLASRVGGIPEVVTADYLGQLTPPGDLVALAGALGESLAKEPRREQIRQHGLQFSWERAAKAYSDLLERALIQP